MRRASNPRRIRRALIVLEQLPRDALALLAERVIDRLDALGAADIDLEPDEDGCLVEDAPWLDVNDHFAGDPEDAEDGGDMEPVDCSGSAPGDCRSEGFGAAPFTGQAWSKQAPL